jgi:hypothetical protein
MTRSERINKLGNAIKLYRGIYNSETGKWIRPPQPNKRADVERWLNTLRIGKYYHHPDKEQVVKDLARIDGFKTRTEYAEWIKTI